MSKKGKLVSFVHVLIPEGQENAGQTVAFGPGDKVPAWAAEQMGDHCFVSGKRPSAEKASAGPGDIRSGVPVVDTTDSDDDDDDSDSSEADEAPPRAGAGSGRDAWAAYAEAQGVDVEEGATRDQIIESLADAGKIDK